MSLMSERQTHNRGGAERHCLNLICCLCVSGSEEKNPEQLTVQPVHVRPYRTRHTHDTDGGRTHKGSLSVYTTIVLSLYSESGGGQ